MLIGRYTDFFNLSRWWQFSIYVCKCDIYRPTAGWQGHSQPQQSCRWIIIGHIRHFLLIIPAHNFSSCPFHLGICVLFIQFQVKCIQVKHFLTRFFWCIWMSAGLIHWQLAICLKTLQWRLLWEMVKCQLPGFKQKSPVVYKLTLQDTTSWMTDNLQTYQRGLSHIRVQTEVWTKVFASTMDALSLSAGKEKTTGPSASSGKQMLVVLSGSWSGWHESLLKSGKATVHHALQDDPHTHTYTSWPQCQLTWRKVTQTKLVDD